MAIMIPEKPREFKKESREDLMFNALSRLPDEYYVVHSFQMNKVENNNLFDSEADFVIFNRKKGILCIEAKASRVEYRNGEWYYGSGDKMHGGGPVAQARRSMYAIKEYMEKHGLKHIADNCKFLHTVWFPNVSADYMRRLNLPVELSPDLMLTEEALYDPLLYIERIFAITERGKTETDISEQMALRVVNEVLCPQFEIAPSATFEADTRRIIFHRLLKEQAAVLNFLEEQKTAIINGAAGTGKTLVAVEKAKREAFKGEKVLFLCFNAQLKNYLADVYSNENIDYYTVAGFACSLCHNSEPDYDRLASVLSDMWEKRSFPYSHVVVDEGQDFGNEEIEEADILEILRGIIEDTKEEGSFYVFYDRLQMIQSRRMPGFLENADCKLTLYRNCRNTENIARTSLRPITDRNPKLMPNCIAGAPAKLHFCQDDDACLAAVDDAIDSILAEGIEDIVILTMTRETDSIVYPYLEDGFYPAGKRKLRFTTCRKFKGLEADAVLLVDVDAGTFAGQDVQKTLLYYVGASRAKLRLKIFTTMTDDDCSLALQALGKGERIKRPQREFARFLNTLPVIETPDL